MLCLLRTTDRNDHTYSGVANHLFWRGKVKEPPRFVFSSWFFFFALFPIFSIFLSFLQINFLFFSDFSLFFNFVCQEEEPSDPAFPLFMALWS